MRTTLQGGTIRAPGPIPIKKSELYSSLWKSCDELRGGMDASQYKDYILVLLFVKYVSDRYGGQKDALVDVPPGGSFVDMTGLKTNIGEGIDKIIARLADRNQLRGVIDVASFNDETKLGKGKEMEDRLSRLIKIFSDDALDFRSNRADGDDLLGDAYEYLMRNFATESGKSKGQFYTPAEVSRIMAHVVGTRSATSNSQSIYDPTCGSGSLLLKAHDEAASCGLDLALYGQEMDNATYALARMNMILHGCPTAEIWKDNTLASPHFKRDGGALKTFDFVVANPPFSTKAWSNGFNPADDDFGRFPPGLPLPPPKNGDYAFLLHILASLKTTGKGACILPHGVLFRGGAEAALRKYFVQNGFLKAIIGLPPNLFYGTGIPACILVLDRENAQARRGIFLIDASRGFIKDGNKNRLREQDIHRIVDTFSRQLEVTGYSRLVPHSDISDPRNDFNLNLSRYIDGSEPEDLHDIDAHLRGGIPERDIDALSPYWKLFPGLRPLLLGPADRPGYLQPTLPVADIRAAILEHPEFLGFQSAVRGRLSRWRQEAFSRFQALKIGDHPREMIGHLSESLLDTFSGVELLDPYDLYQHLMDFWAQTLRDDAYLIAQLGWLDAARPRLLNDKKEQKSRETPDFVVGKQRYKSDLLPASLLIQRFFRAEHAEVERLQGELSSVEQRADEMKEEHGAEDGLFQEVTDDAGKISRKAVNDRLKAIARDRDADDERKALRDYADLLDQQTDLRARLRAAEALLEEKLAFKYMKLTEPEVRLLTIDDKWLARIDADLQAELERVSHTLTSRLRLLIDRYVTPLPALSRNLASLSDRVRDHLRSMGSSCRASASHLAVL